MRKRSF